MTGKIPAPNHADIPDPDIIDITIARLCTIKHHTPEPHLLRSCLGCTAIWLLNRYKALIEHARCVNTNCNRCHKTRPVLTAQQSPIGLICQPCHQAVDWEEVKALDEQISNLKEGVRQCEERRAQLVKGET